MRKHEWIDEKGVTYWVDESPVGFYQGPYGAKIPERVASEMLRLANENAALMAEAERLKKALDQAIAVSELVSHCPGWMSCERNDEIEASGYPELAAYLKETAPLTKEGE